MKTIIIFIALSVLSGCAGSDYLSIRHDIHGEALAHPHGEELLGEPEFSAYGQ